MMLMCCDFQWVEVIGLDHVLLPIVVLVDQQC